MSRSVRRSRRVERDQSSSLASYRGSAGNDGETPAARTSSRRQRVRAAYVVRVAEELSDRDRAIIESVRQLHVVSGAQLELVV
ncbi:hypothetical protein [Candidatus Protofrankia californiensis]|uniref:hypothetical protein n=1 Tax=Candidatus Protofrankia californiensis TaxID=1839754 RepID=UPI001040E2F6|nr:hypothetical protein [Candidatus Protofrankia californiensis]